MTDLILYQQYSRKEVRDALEPAASYTPGAGAWGIQGVINVQGKFEHFVFFVTYGREQSGHSFDEGIDKNGTLSWQSQPSQHLQEKRVQKWVNQNKNKCTISLLVRNDKTAPYIYMGELAYVTHDDTREKPVWFKFQIINWRYFLHLHSFINPRQKNKSSSKVVKKPVRNSSIASTLNQVVKNSASNQQLKVLLDLHPELLGVEEGKELQYEYETTLGSIIPLVVHAPGKEKFVVMYAETRHDGELFLEAGRLIQYSVELAIELGKPLETSDIKKVLFLSRGNLPVTKNLANNYQILLVFLD